MSKKEKEEGKIPTWQLKGFECKKSYQGWLYFNGLVFGSDKYWEFVWSQEYMDLINPNKKGQKNELFGKVGKFNAAPFPSMVVIVTQDSIRDNQSPTIKTLKAPKFKYEV